MGSSMADLAEGDDVRGISVHAGFPNPAADRSHTPLSLDRLLVKHPSSTYFFRIEGNSWTEQGIYSGDIAVIDRALDPLPNDLTVCWRDEQFVILRCHQLTESEPVWGIVSSVIHQYNREKS